MAIGTVDVDCPRCDNAITCNVEATPKPGRSKFAGRSLNEATLDLDLRVTDLRERFAEHYEAAGHTTPANKASQ